MIIAAFFGSRVFENAVPIAAAMAELIGTADVDGRAAGVRAADRVDDPADGALVVVHCGSPTGVAKRADELARRRGLTPTVMAQNLAVCDRSGVGPVPCSCPRDGWLHADGRRYRFCRAAARRRNAETVAWMLARQAADPAIALAGRGWLAGADDDAVEDMHARLLAAGIESRLVRS